MKWKSTVPEGRSGKYRVEKFTVPPHDFHAWKAGLTGGRYVPAGDYTRLLHDDMKFDCIMSDTPAEQRDHFCAFGAAKGRVLINGLGLGVFLEAILEKPEVEQVTVIEISEDVIKLVGSHHVFRDDPRVEIIHADAMTWRPARGKRFECVWHDIWPTLCVDNLDDMKVLHRSYGQRCEWQGSWGKEWLQAERRREGL